MAKKPKNNITRRSSATASKLAAEKISSDSKNAVFRNRRDSSISQRSAATVQSKSFKGGGGLIKRSDSNRFGRKPSFQDSRAGTPTGQKRGSCFGKRSKKVRVVSEAVAISRIQRWFRRMSIIKHMSEPGQLRETIDAQKVKDERLEEIRANLAKITLKKFFNTISAVGSGSAPRGTMAAHRDRVRNERAKSNMDMLGNNLPVEYVEVVEAAILAKASMMETLARENKRKRYAVRTITKFWSRTKLYKHLRQLSSDQLAQRILCRQEIIERRDIIRRYYKDFIQLHQDCFNSPLILNNGQGTRTVPLYISLILFSSDYSLEEIMDDVKKPYGVGPYHPYGMETIPEDFKTLRMLERRFMFSKEERQLLQEEGIMDVNEPPRPDPTYFDPDFVFGSVLDYLRPGEFADKYRNNHPSLQLGIRRTSSLILDRDFRIIGENGEAEEGKHVKPLPSARFLRRAFGLLHQYMKKLGYVKSTEIDGSYDPSANRSETWSVDALDLEEDPRERKLHNDLLLILRPQLSNNLHVNARSHTVPIVQEQLALGQSRLLSNLKSSCSILQSGGSVVNAFLHPSLQAGGPPTRVPNQDPTHRERRASAVQASPGIAGGGNKVDSKAQVSKHAQTKIEGPDKVKLFKYFSSTRVLGSTWKSFIEETNFSAAKKKPRTVMIDDSVLGTTRDCFGGELASRSEMTRATFTEGAYPDSTILTSSRTHKHLSMVLGDPEERQELGLQYFLNNSKHRKHYTSMEGDVLPGADSRGVSVEPDGDKDTMSDVAPGKMFSSQLLERPFFAKPPPPSVSPFIADPRKIMYLDLQSEFERLATQEHRFRHILYRRFMLLNESIVAMCRLEAERKLEFRLKLLDGDA